MTENRALLRTVPGRRHREAVADPFAASAAPIDAPAPCETCLPDSDDGLAALRYVLPPGARATGPDPGRGNGQYWVVLAGSLLHDGIELAPRSCLFMSPDEAAFTAVAGPRGLEVLALQFPRRTVPCIGAG